MVVKSPNLHGAVHVMSCLCLCHPEQAAVSAERRLALVSHGLKGKKTLSFLILSRSRQGINNTLLNASILEPKA